MKTQGERLKELLDYYGISQAEFVKRTGIAKSNVSSYINNNRKMKQDKIKLVAECFSVNEPWLMGYDVPMRGKKSPCVVNLALSPKAEQVAIAYENADYLTQRLVERTLGLETEQKKREDVCAG